MLTGNFQYFLCCCSQGADISSIVSQCPPHPVIIIVGDYRNPIQGFLVCEKKMICEIPTKESPIYLLALYYVFNMCYPKGCNNFYAFIEIGIFNLAVKNVPITIGTFLTRLNALKFEQ